MRIARKADAKDNGSNLITVGFTEIGSNESLEYGDVRVIQSCEGHPHGHIQIWTDIGWVSDFKQTDMWPGPRYREHKPSYITYRYTD